jgi:hypothetical protein
MNRWDELLAHLAMQPRENGSAALTQTAEFLATTLAGFGVPVERLAFTAYPYRHRVCGVVALIGAVAYAWALRSRRRALALAIALISPTVILLELDYYVGWVTWMGAANQEHVIARVAAPASTQRVILTAHYDTKTDLLDHVERAPVDLLSLPMTLMMIAAPLAGIVRARSQSHRDGASRFDRILVPATIVYGLSVFLVLTGGAFVRQRSPGALDDGAACAILVRVVEALSRAPLTHTDVEVALLSAEEIGVQGSRDFVRARLLPPQPHTSVINFELIGATANLAVFGSERFTLHSYPADPELVRVLDGVHAQRRNLPLHVTWYGASTDARSFLQEGIPAVTLLSDLPEHALARGMHSAHDTRDRIDEAALDETLAFVMAVLQQLDSPAP